MNTKLLLKVKAAILAEPLKFDMAAWFAPEKKSPCGTTACIAGWAISLDRKWKRLKPGLSQMRHFYFRPEKLAGEAIGIDFDQTERLFFRCNWPPGMSHAYVHETTARGRARIAARRIDHFIKTNGAE